MFELDAHVRERMIRLAVNILGFLTAPPSQGGTPRDTGFAVSNWRIVTTEDTITVGDKKAVTFGPQMMSRNGLVRYRLSDGPLLIVNNVSYLPLLNAGSSAQAAPNFIQAAAAKAMAAAKGLA